MSSKTRNRLQHALNGNTSPSASHYDPIIREAVPGEVTVCVEEAFVEEIVCDPEPMHGSRDASEDEVEFVTAPSLPAQTQFPHASQFSVAFDFGDAPRYDYDRTRCEALVWVAKGMSLRQCSNTCKHGQRCGTHRTKAPHGTVWSPSAAKISESQKNPVRRKN